MRIKIVFPKLDWLISKINSLTIKVKDLSTKTSPRLNRATKRIVDFKREYGFFGGNELTGIIGMIIGLFGMFFMLPIIQNTVSMNSNFPGDSTLLFSSMLPIISVGVVASVFLSIFRQ